MSRHYSYEAQSEPSPLIHHEGTAMSEPQKRKTEEEGAGTEDEPTPKRSSFSTSLFDSGDANPAPSPPVPRSWAQAEIASTLEDAESTLGWQTGSQDPAGHPYTLPDNVSAEVPKPKVDLEQDIMAWIEVGKEVLQQTDVNHATTEASKNKGFKAKTRAYCTTNETHF